jgi:hypothetical protein
MTALSAPTVFISYTNVDKLVARRIFRQFIAHHVNAIFDERALELGTRLTPSIRSKIESADILLVVASQASANASWVELEMKFADDDGKAVIPVFIEPVSAHPRFKDYKGIDATQREAFAEVIHELIRTLFSSMNLELPAVDIAVSVSALRELEKEEPDLTPFISGTLDFDGLAIENCKTVYNVPFHALDYTINTMFDVKRDIPAASCAASAFSFAGAGVRALSSWIEHTGNGGLQLVYAIGHTIEPSRIPAAIKLLARCQPPNDQALCDFIHSNASQLDDLQRRSVIRLLTWPIREDSGGSRCDAASVALKHFPDAKEIQQIWSRWIHAGSFDGTPDSPQDLAWFLSEAHKKVLPGWEPVNGALRSHVRDCLRSGNGNAVEIAMSHIEAAADEGVPVLADLLREAEGAPGCYEWNQWHQRDPDAADSMRWYLRATVREARSDRDWARARVEAEKMFEYQKRR